MTEPTKADLDVIRYGAVLTQMTKSAEFAAAVDSLTEKLTTAQKRRADLLIAEDEARFGNGDLAAVRADLDAIAADIEELEKTIAGAQKRQQSSAATEAMAELDQTEKEAGYAADELAHVWGQFWKQIETARSILFEADRVTRKLAGLNGSLESAGRRGPNIDGIRQQALKQSPQAKPGTISIWARDADNALLAFYSGGGPLRRVRSPNRHAEGFSRSAVPSVAATPEPMKPGESGYFVPIHQQDRGPR